MSNFEKDLTKGKKGEQLFLEYAPFNLIALNGRESDFVDEFGDTWELKSDQYDMDKTSNFFIEVISNDNNFKKGGPWQAAEHGSKYWVYFFPKNMKAFIFDTLQLVEWLNLNNHFETIRIPNKFYNTIGIKVPRADLKHLYMEIDLNDRKHIRY